MKRTVYLILFRGVGGKTQLPTQALREALTEAGFENVATYINSGNAFVRSRLNRKQVIATIAELCRSQFDFDKVIFAVTLAEWDNLIERNPFAKAAANSPTTVHTTNGVSASGHLAEKIFANQFTCALGSVMLYSNP
jgi:uncharacterized protein (DUF1697 family)